MEWNDPKARYPNLWSEGMPRHILALDTVAGRLRLGDLVATFHPASQRHPERSERFVGLSRVVGLRRAETTDHAWIDLETAHRFDPPLELHPAPRRVFLCCDPGWTDIEVGLFQRLLDAAVAAGFRPRADEAVEPDEPEPARHVRTPAPVTAVADEPPDAVAPPPVAAPAPPAVPHAPDNERCFAGVEFGGDMRDPRHETWLAIASLADDRLVVRRLDATGRSGLEGRLRDPDRLLMRAEAIGLGFPFALPVAFAEYLLGGAFPEQGWWALARSMEKLTRPAFLSRLDEFRREHGAPLRLADETAALPSPLDRSGWDPAPRSYHGIRMIGEDRSRYAVRPFESAQARLLLEVHPAALLERLVPAGAARDGRERHAQALERAAALGRLAVVVDGPLRKACHDHAGALLAVLAARCAAVAVLTGESEKTPDELAPGAGERLRREGWIYGLGEP